MTTFYEIATIPAIAAIVYTIIDIVKTAVGGTEKFKRFIPLVSCALGAICGVIAYFCVPGVMETQNVLVAIVLGAASGLHDVDNRINDCGNSGNGCDFIESSHNNSS